MHDAPDSYVAEGLSRIGDQIRELRPPQRPRFVEDLIRIKGADAVHLLGGQTLTLRGDSAEWVMEVLAPALDGTRTVEELEQLLPEVDAESLLDAIYLLYVNGLLEEGDDGLNDARRESLEEEFGPQMAFFSRYLRVTGHATNRYELQHSLSQARVLLTGVPDLIEVLAAQLKEAGVGSVGRVDCAPGGENAGGIFRDAGGPPSRPYADLVVCVGDLRSQESAARRCLLGGAPLLCVDAEALALGPLMYGRVSACPACALSQLPAEFFSEFVAQEPALSLWRRALVSRAAQQALGFITHLFQPSTLDNVEVWRPGAGRARQQRVVRLPNCRLCGESVAPLSITLPTGHRDNLSLLFHRTASLKPWHIQHPAVLQEHVSASAQSVTRTAYMRYEGAEGEELPEASSGPDAPVGAALAGRLAPSVRLDEFTLGELLRYSAGCTSLSLPDGGFHFLRFTASGGNLGSAEVYAVTLDMEHPSPGLYHYLALNHSLELVRAGHLADELAGCVPGGAKRGDVRTLRDAAVVLIIVGAVERVVAKYAERGYAYCLLDAGLMAHRLVLLAGQLGLSAEMAWEFHDEPLARLLEVDGLRLAPMMLVALYRDAAPKAAAGGDAR